MKLQAITYNSPNPTQGTFQNVFIEEIGYQVKRKDLYLRIEFSMYYLNNEVEIPLCENAFLAFQGLESDPNSTNVRATFLFNNDDENEEPKGLIDYLENNNGAYPTDYKMINWGRPSFDQVVHFLKGGNLNDMEIQPSNAFVKEWIKHNLIMNGDYVGKQGFEFI